MNSLSSLFNQESRIDTGKKLLLEYIRNMEVEKAEGLLKSGVKPIRGFHLWKEYESPLVEAVGTKSAVLVELLLSYGAPVNEEGIHYYTPLQMACNLNAIEIVEILLKNKADINLAKKNLSPKPVFLPAFYGYEELLLMLIERGANLDGIWDTAWIRFSLGVLAILIEYSDNVPEGAVEIWRAESDYEENH